MLDHPAFRALLVASALLAPAAATATTVVVNVNNNSFSPATVNISPGDTVQWVKATSGFHNVSANGASFRSGDATASTFTFSHTFASVGSFGYECEVHGPAMSGTVNVSAATAAGSLSFASATANVGESAGHVTLTLRRTLGDDGAVSAQVTTANGTATAGVDYTALSQTVSWADNDDDQKTVQVAILGDSADESAETFTVSLSGVTGGATVDNGVATVTITDDDTAGTVGFLPSVVEVGEAAGNATLTLQRTAGADGAMSVQVATAGGTATADVDYTTTTTTVSWANGEVTSKTVPVPIVDDGDDEPNETFSATLSGPTGGAVVGVGTATVTIVDNDEAVTVCVADATTLCLNNGRFQVRADWKVPAGTTGQAQVKDIGLEDSGLFTFFGPNNVELLVKLLNGCGVNARYWAFIAAATNVEWHLTVVDTAAGISKSYDNAQGVFPALIADTSAFATCP
jgi:plastocyanin